jgi:uncharacterized membrane protein YagU involved in acid resistance
MFASHRMSAPAADESQPDAETGTIGWAVSPVGAVKRGLFAGIVGTAVMTGWQELSARLLSSEDSGSGDGDADDGAQATEPGDPWETASAPAKVARRAVNGFLQKDIPADKITLTTNVMHWAYGTAWGAAYGLIAGTRKRSSITDGLRFGTIVWASSYAQLVPMGIYEPPWKYSPRTLAMDLSYHLAYGLGTGIGYAVVQNR